MVKQVAQKRPATSVLVLMCILCLGSIGGLGYGFFQHGQSYEKAADSIAKRTTDAADSASFSIQSHRFNPRPGGYISSGRGTTTPVTPGKDATKQNASAAGSAYYVSTTGSDSNSCTQTAPCATINKAADLATPGTTVHVAPGTYTKAVVTEPSGSSTGRIVYISDVKWGAKIDVTGQGAQNVWTNDGDYVDIIGFEIVGGVHEGILDESSQYSRFMENKVHNIGNGSCIDGTSGINDGNSGYTSHDLEISDNLVYAIGPAGYCGIADGIYVSNLRDRVANNIVYGGSGNGIQCWHACSTATIANNTVFNNRASGIIFGGGDDPNYANSLCDHMVITNNIAVYNGEYGIRDFEYSGQNTIGTHNLISNNLVYRNSNGGYFFYYNIDKSVSSITADPQFVNFQANGSGDYHLRATSPAINSGTSTGAPSTDFDGTRRPQGNHFDIGAYEYGGVL